MAGDWIKIQTDLYRHPRVCVIADSLLTDDSELGRYVNQIKQCDMSVTRNVMRNAVVGALVAVWGIARHKGYRSDDDLCLDGVTDAVVDDIADMEGFGEAMVKAGWLVQTPQGLMFPRFFVQHNVEITDDFRQKNRDRQRKFRAAKRNASNGALRHVTVTSQSNVEKSREEKSKKNPPTPFDETPLPYQLGEEFRPTWRLWCEHRRDIKKPLTKTAVRAQLSELAAVGLVAATAAVQHSIANGWQGIFPPKEGDLAYKPASRIPTKEDDANWSPYQNG